jgi:hypothetical protein
LFKAALFTLLTANTAWYAIGGSPSKAIDAVAWLVLLVLFEAENRFAPHLNTTRHRVILRLLRLAAGLGVVAATIGYVFENDVLDAVNSAVWIGVVALLEIELRYKGHVQRARMTFAAVAAGLYGTLAVLVVIWAATHRWFDAYDALLWLVAFAAVELDVMSRATSRGLVTRR